MDDDEPARPLGIVAADGRGSLPFALLHGESMVAVAGWALGEAEVDLLDFNVGWPAVQSMVSAAGRDAGLETGLEAGLGRAVVLHDSLCPLTPVGFLRTAVAEARAGDAVVVGCRPVTDTIKVMAGGRVGATVDRESLRVVTSPIVLPPAVVASLDEWPDVSDFAALVARLRSRFEVRLLDAPALGGRVEDIEGIRLLEALTGDDGPGADPTGG